MIPPTIIVIMKNQRRSNIMSKAWITIPLILVLSSCFLLDPVPEQGAIKITINEVGLEPMTIQPDLEMTVNSYVITLEGPVEILTESLSSSETSVTIDALIPGAWIVTVDALNSLDEVIASQSVEIEVIAGQTVTTTITVVPLSGDGLLSVRVEWPNDVIADPQIVASLTPEGESAIDISNTFSLDTTATPNFIEAQQTLSAGYYTLSLLLYDGSSQVWGRSFSVRILAGEETIGLFGLSEPEMNLVGMLSMGLQLDLQNPADLTFTGVESEITTYDTMTIMLSSSENVDTYSWYVNGNLIVGEIGNSLTVGPSDLRLDEGYYFIDGIVKNGGIVSSDTVSFRIQDQPFMLVEDISVGAGSSIPRRFAEYNSTLYFSASNDTYGEELWAYNGIDEPFFVHDIRSGAEDSMPSWLIEYNGSLYFSALGSPNDTELWKYDGSVVSEIEINVSYGSSSPAYPVIYNGILYFKADNGLTGQEIFYHDGTTTDVEIDIVPSSNSAYTYYLTVWNDELYFSARDATGNAELWMYDWLDANQVAEINPSGASYPSYLTAFGTELCFWADDGSSGYELYAYDGTEVSRVADIFPGSGGSSPDPMAVFDGKLYFRADDGVNGYELWSYDGSSVAIVSDIFEGSTGSYPGYFTVFEGYLWFTATDETLGRELFRYDGVNPPVLLDILPGSESSNPQYMHGFDGRLFFKAEDSVHGSELWVHPI